MARLRKRWQRSQGLRLLMGTACAAAAACAYVSAAGDAVPVKLDLDAEWKLQLAVLAKQIALRDRIFRSVDAYNDQSTILDSDRTPVDVVLRRTEALLSDLAAQGAVDTSVYAPRLGALKEEANGLPAAELEFKEVDQKAQKNYSIPTVTNEVTLLPVFAKACALQREISLRNPLLDFDRIVFVKRNGPAHAHMCDEWYGRVSEPGGSLYVLGNPWSDDATVSDLLAGTLVENGRLKGKTLAPGAFVTPEVDYDAKTIYFAYSGNITSFHSIYKGNERRYSFQKEYYHRPETAFHIFRIGADGSGLTMLTDGEWNDFYPAVLTSGRIAFLSERRGGEGRCHPRPCPTYVMHSMLADGSDIVPISYHEINEWSPVVTNDGRIVYSRWDYVDRGFSKGQHPWVADPDGRDVRALYGNYEGGGGSVQADLRPVPGSQWFFGTMYGHHSASWGTLVAYDSSVVDDGTRNTWKYLTPEVPGYGKPEHRGAFATPYPLSEKYFLCVWSPDAPIYSLNSPFNPTPTKHGIYLVDCFGNKTLLYRPDDVSANMPYPLRKRERPPVIPHATAEGMPPGVDALPTATDADKALVAVMDVYDSKLPWPKDRRIKALRIVQVLPKSTPGAKNPPIAYDREYVARQVLGTVPVEDDGSAYFVMPSRKPVYFQALDADGLAVQSMRSSAYAMPGETMTCLGCHEPKGEAGKTSMLPARKALQRAPSTIKPGPQGSMPYSFPRLVQPVLDAKCVACHEKHEAAPDLSADGKVSPEVEGMKLSHRYFTASYVNLAPYAWSYDTRDYGRKSKWAAKDGMDMRSTPGNVGAHVSKLYALLTTGSHKDKVELTEEEMERIVTWLDCQSVFAGSYHNPQALKEGEPVEPELE